jgi:phosphatidylglycerol:prolipoprotein diacylglycerol transferase
MDTRIAFRLFDLDVYWYGIILTTGMMVAVYVAAMELGRRGYARSILWDGAILVLGLSILGGRLYHVFSEYNDGTPGFSYYRDLFISAITLRDGFSASLANLIEIVNPRSGGLGVFGGITLGALGGVILAIRHKVPFGAMADSIGMGLILGQCIGRWGNFANQELYGPPTNLPWGMPIQEWARTGIYRDLQAYPIETTFFHPSFLYESLWCFLGFIVLLWAERKFAAWMKHGDLFAFYLIFYGAGRAALEATVRLDALTYGGVIPTAVLFGLGFVAFGIVILLINHVFMSARPKPQGPALQGTA